MPNLFRPTRQLLPEFRQRQFGRAASLATETIPAVAGVSWGAENRPFCLGVIHSVVRPLKNLAWDPRRSPRMTHLCSDRVTHQKRRALTRNPQVGKALSPPPKAGRWVRFREQTRVISRECRRPCEIYAKNRPQRHLQSAEADALI